MAMKIYLTVYMPLLMIICCYTSNVAGADPGPLQDFCVADQQSKVLVNGYACKDPTTVTVEDFSFAGLRNAGDTNNPVQSKVTPAFVQEFGGLNTLGMAMGRIDYAVGGLNPPHAHPRASEILLVLQGKLLVGFVDTNNTLFSKILEKGDVFVFPKALPHFQENVGHQHAVAIAAFNSQFPGILTIANSLFAANPPIPDSVLAKAFRITHNLVDHTKAEFEFEST
ncbi:hypothetical protein KI387_028376, partial [Taxus chinensis]